MYSHAAVCLSPVHHGFSLCSGCFSYAEGAFLCASAVCLELRLTSEDAYFNSEVQSLNFKACILGQVLASAGARGRKFDSIIKVHLFTGSPITFKRKF